VDPAKRRALSEFYLEEFHRHLHQLECCGIVHDGNRQAIDRACRKLVGDLDRVCWRADFALVAETVLQSFDTLSGLSQLDTRQAH